MADKVTTKTDTTPAPALSGGLNGKTMSVPEDNGVPEQAGPNIPEQEAPGQPEQPATPELKQEAPAAADALDTASRRPRTFPIRVTEDEAQSFNDMSGLDKGFDALSDADSDQSRKLWKRLSDTYGLDASQRYRYRSGDRTIELAS